MRLLLALLDRHDKQSVSEVVGSRVETSRCGSGENRSLAEGPGSDRRQPCLGHKEWCSKEEGQNQRSRQSQNFGGSQSPVGEDQEAKSEEIIAGPCVTIRGHTAWIITPRGGPRRKVWI